METPARLFDDRLRLLHGLEEAARSLVRFDESFFLLCQLGRPSPDPDLQVDLMRVILLVVGDSPRCWPSVLDCGLIWAVVAFAWQDDASREPARINKVELIALFESVLRYYVASLEPCPEASLGSRQQAGLRWVKHDEGSQRPVVCGKCVVDQVVVIS